MTLWFINEFHFQILALELLLCGRLSKKQGFLFRLIPVSAVYLLLPFLIPDRFLSPYLRIGSWFVISFLLMLLLSALILKFCYHITLKQLVFCCCVAHTLQHMVHCLSRVFWFLCGMEPVPAQVLELVLMAAALVLLYLFLKKDGRFGIEKADIKSGQLVVFAVGSTLTVYFISFWSNWTEGNNVGEQFFDFLSCLLLLIILLDIFRFQHAEQEQLLLRQLLRQEREQHETSRATIEVINRKCHDMKHQISMLRSSSVAEREKSIAELEEAILIYDHMAKTGNDELDIVLAEKAFMAEQKGVVLRFMVDGKQLDFLDTGDLCSIFGNTVENGIEAAAKIPNPEERIFTLNVSRRGSFVTIHAENPCLEAPVFEDGLPVTDKPDADYHGFGMRSMRHAAEKYGGVMTASWEEGLFSLDFLFPVL